MDYDHLFNLQLQKLKDEGNYRVFAELERCRGNFPKAKNYIESNQTSEVTVWCSNDYLGMGQNQNVLNAIVLFSAHITSDEWIPTITSSE